MKRCPTCNNDFSDDANFCPVDAGHLFAIDAAAPVEVPRVDTGGHELLDGRFALGEIIAGHRSGPVYQAGDKEGASAMVKLVAPEVFPSALLKQRTERELKQLERLDHPAVAKVLGFGRKDDDALWIATELVDGVTLDQFVAQSGPLPQPRAVTMVLQIGAALEAAAKLGVTHRDLAPKNILVSPGDQIKIINFGVPVPGPEGKESVQGVSEFVAPEQIDGRPVDQRCNIYSLGAIATLLLTGQPPFSGSRLEVLDAHMSTPVSPLTPEQGVAPELSLALLKALEKTSSKRYMTLRQFLGDIEKSANAISPGGTSQGMPPAGNPGDMKSTLMGVAATDIENAIGSVQSPALGTPPPEEGSGAEGVTSLDHAPPQMQNPSAAEVGAPQPAPVAQPAPEISPAAAVAQHAPAQHTPAPVAQHAPVQPAPAQPQAPSPASPGASSSSAGGKRGGAQQQQQQAPDPTVNKKGKFRETMWFKKGELDEAAARAAAHADSQTGASAKADEMEMDVRYSDDGSITEQDKDRLSLRTGSTMMMEAIAEQAPVKHHVSEDELMSEMTGGRTKILVGMGVGVVVLGIILVVALS